MLSLRQLLRNDDFCKTPKASPQLSELHTAMLLSPDPVEPKDAIP